MKGLKKIALCSAVALAPFAANADLKALNDSAMSGVTGQAGVTIDLSATVDIGEVAYQDQGFLAMSGISLAGQNGTALDDIRLTIDVAGNNDDLGVSAQAETYLAGAVQQYDQAGLADNVFTLASDGDPTIGDGDLVIALRSQTTGAAVDFNLGIDEVALAPEASAANIGSLNGAAGVDPSDNAGTVLVSDLNIDGYIGPVDIVIDGTENTMNIQAFFSAEGSMDMDFIGTSLSFELHNRRGDEKVRLNTTEGSYSFAFADVDISVDEDHIAPGEDALRVNVKQFSGDLDLTEIKMGNDVSIGSIYMTDLDVTADMSIYGH